MSPGVPASKVGFAEPELLHRYRDGGAGHVGVVGSRPGGIARAVLPEKRMKFLRLFLAPMVGLFVLFSAVGGIQSIGHGVHPPPPELDTLGNAYGEALLAGDRGEMERLGTELRAATAAYLETAPVGALWFVVLAWIAGGFLGGGVAAIVAPFGRVPMALAIGLADVGAILLTTTELPHPGWMPAVGIVGALVAAWLGGLLASRAGGSAAVPTIDSPNRRR